MEYNGDRGICNGEDNVLSPHTLNAQWIAMFTPVSIANNASVTVGANYLYNFVMSAANFIGGRFGDAFYSPQDIGCLNLSVTTTAPGAYNQILTRTASFPMNQAISCLNSSQMSTVSFSTTITINPPAITIS